MKKININYIKIALVILAIIICACVYLIAINAYKKEKIAKDNQNNITNEKLYTLDNYPKVDASLSMQPLATAFLKGFIGIEQIDPSYLNYTNNDLAYNKLLNNEVDLLIVSEPSSEQITLARQKGIELEIIPIVKEGFVFYVNTENKVDNLSIEQIQKIYRGEITNWQEVGGYDESIVAYQSPANSISQIGMMSLVMKNSNLMDAPRENLVNSNNKIINLVSNYKNGRNTIGYSYYYYAKTMFQTIDKDVASNIKLLSINRVVPNKQSIMNDSYPFTTAYYIVINKADDSNAASRILANYMLSSRGKKIAENAGYIPVK